jgi:hypothetical protein
VKFEDELQTASLEIAKCSREHKETAGTLLTFWLSALVCSTQEILRKARFQYYEYFLRHTTAPTGLKTVIWKEKIQAHSVFHNLHSINIQEDTGIQGDYANGLTTQSS